MPSRGLGKGVGRSRLCRSAGKARPARIDRAGRPSIIALLLHDREAASPPMTFELNDAQRAFQDMARHFAGEAIAPGSEESRVGKGWGSTGGTRGRPSR